MKITSLLPSTSRKPHSTGRIQTPKTPSELGGYVLEHGGQIIARGGLMLNYNFPYADLYMDVLEAHRGKGFGSFIVQELKKAAIEAGYIPAAKDATYATRYRNTRC